MAQQNLVTLKELHQFNNLDLLAKQVVEGFMIGLHKSPFHGFSVEFAEHRLYNPGESIKNIDWKVFARTDRLYVKRYEEETNLRCQMIIDTSSSMFFPEEALSKGQQPINKLRFSAVSAAAVMYLLKKQRDAYGLSIFSDAVETHTKARSSGTHYNLLMAYLQQVLEGVNRNRPTNAAHCIHQIAENIPRRSMVMIFSDMLDRAMEGEESAEELFSALQHLKYNKHEVVLFHVVDSQHELDFKFENRPYVFVDLESGEQLKLQPNQVREQYVEKMAAFKAKLKLKCAQFKIDFVEADVNKDFSQILLPYLVKRSKMN